MNNQTVIEFANYETVDLVGRFGDDKFSVSPVGVAAETTLDQCQSAAIRRPRDELLVNGSAVIETITVDYDAALPNTSTVQVSGVGVPLVNFDGTTERLTINGLGGNDTLSVTDDVGGANADLFVLTPGATVDAGLLQLNQRQPLTFLGLGTTGQLSLLGGGGADTLIYNGTAASDTFTVPHGVVRRAVDRAEQPGRRGHDGDRELHAPRPGRRRHVQHHAAG